MENRQRTEKPVAEATLIVMDSQVERANIILSTHLVGPPYHANLACKYQISPFVILDYGTRYFSFKVIQISS